MNIYAMIYVWVNVCMTTTFIFAFIWIMYVFVIIFRDHCLFAVFTNTTTLHQTSVIKSIIAERFLLSRFILYPEGAPLCGAHYSENISSVAATSSSVTSSSVTSSIKPFIMESSPDQIGSTSLLYQHHTDARKSNQGSR